MQTFLILQDISILESPTFAHFGQTLSSCFLCCSFEEALDRKAATMLHSIRGCVFLIPWSSRQKYFKGKGIIMLIDVTVTRVQDPSSHQETEPLIPEIAHENGG